MRSLVRVVRPKPIDRDALERLLGEPPLAIEHIDAPSIVVDDRYHLAACRWLLRKQRLRPVDGTVLAHARRLALWIAYLRHERGRDHPEPFAADVFAATEDDMAAYYRARQFNDETRVSSATWRAQLSTIKQFHEYLRDTYGLALPFALSKFRTPAGTTVTSAHDLRPRTRTGSRGTPITPGFAELLIQGALRIDADGRQSEARTVDRDAAFISLGLATGMRLETLANITTYEIPATTSQPFTSIRVPDFITKGDAGGDALVFSHRLTLVHHYLNADRAERVAEGQRWEPTNPIHLLQADEDGWSGMLGEERISGRWAETTAHVRRRMVNPDGTTPVAWVDARTGTPIVYHRSATITANARNWTREHVHPDFPASFRTHDLRHTYATHLTVCIYKQAVTPHVHPDVADAYTPVRIADAVEIAKLSLGHASEASTRLYLQQAPKLLHIDTDEFLGRN
ncbi:MAG: hypothetical protein R6T85_12060 [Egibacteraceae bacterium]